MILVVGARSEDSHATGVNGDQSDNSNIGSGAAYIFVRSGTNWSQQAYLKASNSGGLFGSAASISGDTVVVGAHFEASNATGVNGQQTDNNATNSGAAYIFVRDGTNWGQQAYLKASNREAGDYFGHSVSVSGNIVIVGADRESSIATGVNGNQNNNGASESGAAYVFVRSGTNWSQQAYLKASNNSINYYFGSSVSASGHTVVVGSEFATFVGGAYVFTSVGLGPQLDIASDESGGYIIRCNGAADITYRLQRSASVSGPWNTIDTQTAPASGLIEYHETNPPANATFYRTVTQ